MLDTVASFGTIQVDSLGAWSGDPWWLWDSVSHLRHWLVCSAVDIPWPDLDVIQLPLDGPQLRQDVFVQLVLEG